MRGACLQFRFIDEIRLSTQTPNLHLNRVTIICYNKDAILETEITERFKPECIPDRFAGPHFSALAGGFRLLAPRARTENAHAVAAQREWYDKRFVIDSATSSPWRQKQAASLLQTERDQC